MDDRGDGLTAAERDRLETLRSAESLAALVAATEATTEHDAYLAARAEWRRLMDRALPPADPGGLPGDAVTVDGTRFVVHGVTHADTDAERAHLRDHVADLLAAGATVYCEQGIRSMYFDDMPAVCSMDDYRWALRRCRELGEGTAAGPAFDGPLEDLAGVAARFREAAFSLVHAGTDLYGEATAAALGDVATAFLTSHADVARAREFEAFVRSRRAAEDPSRLAELQRYYATVFLPQPLEREWLRRHDPELDVVSHGRSARMADYAVAHADGSRAVHLVVGAAHQPGVVAYLREHRDGDRDTDGFELAG